MCPMSWCTAGFRVYLIVLVYFLYVLQLLAAHRSILDFHNCCVEVPILIIVVVYDDDDVDGR